MNTSFLKRPPSGDSSWMYSPVKYRCTSVDFPELSEPTIPNRSSGTVRDIVHSWLFTKESARRRECETGLDQSRRIIKVTKRGGGNAFLFETQRGGVSRRSRTISVFIYFARLSTIKGGNGEAVKEGRLQETFTEWVSAQLTILHSSGSQSVKIQWESVSRHYSSCRPQETTREATGVQSSLDGCYYWPCTVWLLYHFPACHQFKAHSEQTEFE